MKPQLTIEAFADWCEKQPADGVYDYTHSSSCAVAQFLQSAGVQNYDLFPWEIPERFQEPVREYPWAFGALSARLRAVQS